MNDKNGFDWRNTKCGECGYYLLFSVYGDEDTQCRKHVFNSFGKLKECLACPDYVPKKEPDNER